MAAKAFSIEDGNLSNKTIITSRKRLYNDIDLAFLNRTSGDIFKKTDAAAVKQSIKNLLLTNKREKPFNPSFGTNLNSLLFGNSEEFDEIEVKSFIANAIRNHESRAVLRDIYVDIDEEYYTANVTVIFQVISTRETVQLNVSLARLR
jgi:phage baseplate assembly protein W